MARKVVLIDMDGTIARTDKLVEEKLLEIYDIRVDLSERKDFEYEPHIDKEARYIMSQKGFFLGIKPIPGAIEAIKEMSKSHDVFFCTAPLSQYVHCVPEKYQWIERYFGFEWTRKMILTKDKTLIRGDILIDDRVQKGILTPTWEQVYFEQPYNKTVVARKLTNWSNWRSLFDSSPTQVLPTYIPPIQRSPIRIPNSGPIALTPKYVPQIPLRNPRTLYQPPSFPR